MPGHEVTFVCSDRRKQKLFAGELPAPVLVSVVDGGQLGCVRAGEGLLALVVDSSAAPVVERRSAMGPEVYFLAPVILLTPDGDRACEPPHWADAVVSWNRVGGRMWPAVRRVIIEWLLAEFAPRIWGRLASTGGLAPALRGALDSTQPIPSIEDLADRHGVCARGYFTEWKVAFGTTMTLADLLDWYLFMRTLAAKVPNQGWTEACRITHTTQPRVKRIAERLVGVNLDAVEDGEPLRAITGFCAATSVLTSAYSATQGISRIERPIREMERGLL